MLEVCLVKYSRPERVSLIEAQLKEQTYKKFHFNVWDNTKKNLGSVARFALARKTKGSPIIFIDDDENLDFDFVEYMLSVYEPNTVKGWYTRVFEEESYWNSRGGTVGEEVDYVGTGGMILDRAIIDDLYVPGEFAKAEDLYLSYVARQKGIKLVCVEPKCSIVVDGKDQYIDLADYKEDAFKELRKLGWKLKREF